MPWGRLDDGLYDHPKLDALGRSKLAAVGLHALAISWCNRWLTDGLVPVERVRRLGGTVALAELLVVAGLWEKAETGYLIHDFLEYNQAKQAVLADREIGRRRAAMNANPALSKVIRERDGDQCRYCGKRVNWRDRRGQDGGTYDHILPVAQDGDESPDNLVVCCRACNQRKGPRTPDQAGMRLRPVSVQVPARYRTDAVSESLDPVPSRPVPARPSPDLEDPQPPQSGGSGGTKRTNGTSPRANGTNPRAIAAEEAEANVKAQAGRRYRVSQRQLAYLRGAITAEDQAQMDQADAPLSLIPDFEGHQAALQADTRPTADIL
ncbi:MAG: HNH endonuclease [Actinomycetes bacterium]